MLVPMSERSNSLVCGCSLAPEIAGSNPAGDIDFFSPPVVSVVFSDRGLWDELITRPEESCELCSVVVCDLGTLKLSSSWSTLGRSATE